MRTDGLSEWEEIENNSLVKVPLIQDNRNWHWVVWKKGMIYDPSYGIVHSSRYPKAMFAISRLPFIYDPGENYA